MDTSEERRDCEACGRALVNPHCGVYQVGCAQCQIRHLANSPSHVRADAYRAVELWRDRDALKAEVSAEYKRIHGEAK